MKMSAKERDQLTAEFNILSSLRHPNIVQYFHREHLKASQELYLYMEYCGGGDLGMVIKNLKATNSFADEDFVWRILSQLLTALYRCHYGVDSSDVGSKIYGPIPEKPAGLKGKQAQVMILHRDLKPENSESLPTQLDVVIIYMIIFIFISLILTKLYHFNF
jgi:NIMA (never in mitosis gene a)-related kinase 2